jgi:hypothetical protein
LQKKGNMTLSDFNESIKKGEIPIEINPILKALFYDAKGDWEAAHDIAQSQEGTPEYDRLHAYLHRKEGDDWNANYWYRRAKTTMPKVDLATEWLDLVKFYVK